MIRFSLMAVVEAHSPKEAERWYSDESQFRFTQKLEPSIPAGTA
jgi:hypothetical protein